MKRASMHAAACLHLQSSSSHLAAAAAAAAAASTDTTAYRQTGRSGT